MGVVSKRVVEGTKWCGTNHTLAQCTQRWKVYRVMPTSRQWWYVIGDLIHKGSRIWSEKLLLPLNWDQQIIQFHDGWVYPLVRSGPQWMCIFGLGCQLDRSKAAIGSSRAWVPLHLDTNPLWVPLLDPDQTLLWTGSGSGSERVHIHVPTGLTSWVITSKTHTLPVADGSGLGVGRVRGPISTIFKSRNNKKETTNK